MGGGVDGGVTRNEEDGMEGGGNEMMRALRAYSPVSTGITH